VHRRAALRPGAAGQEGRGEHGVLGWANPLLANPILANPILANPTSIKALLMALGGVWVCTETGWAGGEGGALSVLWLAGRKEDMGKVLRLLSSPAQSWQLLPVGWHGLPPHGPLIVSATPALVPTHCRSLTHPSPTVFQNPLRKFSNAICAADLRSSSMWRPLHWRSWWPSGLCWMTTQVRGLDYLPFLLCCFLHAAAQLSFSGTLNFSWIKHAPARARPN
jgi:hypothetical protein